MDEALTQVSKVYEISEAADHFVRMEKDGGHDFPPDVRVLPLSGWTNG
ncbi:MAG: hypothetical protein AB2L24_32205 [Mangrovibacterium sp.]